MPFAETQLVDRYREIANERMRGLPIFNNRLEVEAVGFVDFDGHRLGILVTPWFMNLVLLPGTDDWSTLAAGDAVNVTLPEGDYEFRVCCDDVLGVFLSAVLFRTVADFPGQQMAHEIAQLVLEQLLAPRDEAAAPARKLSRRSLLTGIEER
ncbi:MAG: [NiFe]-hydrogenase assembly chaperone HybE [Woeseiaceae bacterium]|nr:[NiFe]-hydrogenase assembly chaperone HybE [Woeseiaceae bacterium]